MNPNHRFLVVDDFAPMREIVRKILQDLGYQHILDVNDGSTRPASGYIIKPFTARALADKVRQILRD
jgi:DNA-binding response OmpR family regulator